MKIQLLDVINSKIIEDRINELEKNHVWELNELKGIREVVKSVCSEGYHTWNFDTVFIRDGFFMEYAKKLIYREAPTWIADNVDIPSATLALQSKFHSIGLSGVRYWVKK